MGTNLWSKSVGRTAKRNRFDRNICSHFWQPVIAGTDESRGWTHKDSYLKKWLFNNQEILVFDHAENN